MVWLPFIRKLPSGEFRGLDHRHRLFVLHVSIVIATALLYLAAFTHRARVSEIANKFTLGIGKLLHLRHDPAPIQVAKELAQARVQLNEQFSQLPTPSFGEDPKVRKLRIDLNEREKQLAAREDDLDNQNRMIEEKNRVIANLQRAKQQSEESRYQAEIDAEQAQAEAETAKVEKAEAQAVARKHEREKKALALRVERAEEQRDEFYRKLKNAPTETDRKKVREDAALLLDRDDVEAIIILEQLTNVESKGRQVRGPKVPRRRPVSGRYYDYPYGFAQIMGQNARSWSRQWSIATRGIDRSYSPEELMGDVKVYRAVALWRIRQLLKRYNHNHDDVIAAWHSGGSLARARRNHAHDQHIYTEQYVMRVKRAPIVDPVVWKNARRYQTN